MFSPSDERAPKEDSALARWAADPANTAWMESKYTDLREAGGAVPSSSPGPAWTLPQGSMCVCQVPLIIPTSLQNCIRFPEGPTELPVAAVPRLSEALILFPVRTSLLPPSHTGFLLIVSSQYSPWVLSRWSRVRGTDALTRARTQQVTTETLPGIFL